MAEKETLHINLWKIYVSRQLFRLVVNTRGIYFRDGSRHIKMYDVRKAFF